MGALLADSASADTARPDGDRTLATRERPATVRPSRVVDLSRLRISISIEPITRTEPAERLPDEDFPDEQPTHEQVPEDEAAAAKSPAAAQADIPEEETPEPPATEATPVEPQREPVRRSDGGLLGAVGAVTNTVTSTVTTTVTGLTSTVTGLTNTVGSIVTALPAIVTAPLQQGPLPLPIDGIVRPIESGLGDLIGLTPPTVTPRPGPVAADPVPPVVAAPPAALPPARVQTIGSSTTEAFAATAYATRTVVDHADQGEPGSEGGPVLPLPGTPCAPAGHGSTATSGHDGSGSRGQHATLPAHPKANSPPVTAGEKRREAAEASYLPGMPVTSPD
jgi:hypothetical protein